VYRTLTELLRRDVELSMCTRFLSRIDCIRASAPYLAEPSRALTHPCQHFHFAAHLKVKILLVLLSWQTWETSRDETWV
jgi:hypothetical protein